LFSYDFRLLQESKIICKQLYYETADVTLAIAKNLLGAGDVTEHSINKIFEWFTECLRCGKRLEYTGGYDIARHQYYSSDSDEDDSDDESVDSFIVDDHDSIEGDSDEEETADEDSEEESDEDM
jgi:hypothetical protein